MLGSHLKYQQSRKDARDKIESEDRPYWLQTYSKIIKNQQSSPIYQELLATLKPWESEKVESIAQAEALDERWTAFRGRWRNDLALSIRRTATKRAWFESFIMCTIVMASVVTGLELEDPAGMADTSMAIDIFALVIFTIECALKILAEGERPGRYFTDAHDGAYNSFDFIIVILSFVFLGQEGQGAVQCMRLLRLLRLLTLIKTIRQLNVIVVGLFQGFKSSGYIIVLLIMVIYIFAIVAVSNFGANDPGHFGELGVAMLTLFQISTLSSWAGIAYISIYGCDEYGNGLYDTSDVAKNPSEVTYKDTVLGTFPLWDCVAPEKGHVSTELFYFVFTTITALVVMSLFVGAIAMAMFTAFTNLEMAELFDGIAAGEKARKVKSATLSPFSDLGRKFDAILSDAEVPEAVSTWSGQFDAQAAAFFCFTVSEHTYFQTMITFTILGVAVVTGIETDYGSSTAIDVVNHAAVLIFLLEMFVKIGAHGTVPGTSLDKCIQKYLHDNWNKFDFFIILVAVFEYLPIGANQNGPWVVLRLMRILRLFRLAKSFPRLRSIIEALGDGMSSSLWMLLLIGILNYILACLGVIIFSSNDPFHFGSLGSAFFSVWRVETLDDWDVILRVNLYGCETYPKGYPFSQTLNVCDNETAWGYVAVFYFVTTVICGGLILPTVLVGIVAVSFERAWQKFSEEMIMNAILGILISNIETQMPEWWSTDRLRLINTTFAILDENGVGSLDMNDVETVLVYLIKVYVAAVPYDWPLTTREHAVVLEHMKDLFMVMDSSGNASVNVVEFVSFMITTKQVQIKLRQQGIIDAEGLNDATRIDRKRRRARLYDRPDKENGEDESGPTSVQASKYLTNASSASTASGSAGGQSAALLHPQMPVFTGAEYANIGKHSLVEDLATCLSHASDRLKLEPMELERWLALQITQLSLADFENASPSSKLRSSIPAYTLRHHKSSYRGEATVHGRFDADTGESLAAPHLNEFSFRVTPVGGRKVDASTQTLLKVESNAQGVLDSEQSGIEPSKSRLSELPLISQGFAQAMQRSQAWQPNHKLVGSEHTLLPLPMLPFAALTNPAHAPAPTPAQFAGSFSNANASARDQGDMRGAGKQGSRAPAIPSVVGLALGSVHRHEKAAAASAREIAGQEESARKYTGNQNDEALEDAHAPLLRNNSRGSHGGIAGAAPRTAASVFGRPVGTAFNNSSSSSINGSGGANWGGYSRRGPLAGSREAL